MKQSPRRREVRDLCERVFEVLSDQLNDSAEFGRSFLTELRDLLSEGISFEHAVLSFEVVPPAFAEVDEEGESSFDPSRR